RDLAHAAAVCGRGEEPQEAILAGEVAVLVVAFDADAVERHRTVDSAPAIGLRDDEEIFRSGVFAELGRERSGAARGRFRADAAKDAQAALRDRRQVVLAVA